MPAWWFLIFSAWEDADQRHVPANPTAHVPNDAIREGLSGEMTKCLQDKLGGYEIPKEFIHLNKNFSRGNGIPTQTMTFDGRTDLEQL